MRNLIHLGRSRTAPDHCLGIEDQDAPITALAPVAGSDSEFYVARGPTAKHSEVEVHKFQVVP
jgi:hypothetical protein